MAKHIINGAPMVVEYGTQDLSIPPRQREPESVPQHLPKFFIFAKKGPTEPQLVVGAERLNMYGEETFDTRSKFFNHSTAFANLANDQGNMCMLQRVIPEDAGPEANMVVWLDVLPATVDLYERNDDRSIKLDQFGDPILDGTTEGYRVKWVVTHRESENEAQQFGMATQTTGDQVDPTTGTTSVRYPIFELKTSFRCEDGNNAGIRLWAPTKAGGNTMPTKLMANEKVYPYSISVIKRKNALSTPKIRETVFGEQNLMFTFKEGVIDPLTERQIYIGDNFISSYESNDPRFPQVYGEFQSLYVYNDNIESLLEQFHAAEIPFIDVESDFTDEPEDKHLFNFITGVDSGNAPYHSYIFVDSPSTVRFSEHTNVYANGGSDGTLSNENFETLVMAEMERYLDSNDPVQDLAYNVESHFYDSGYSLEAKYALCNSIAVRKDTVTVLGTYTTDGPTHSSADEYSIAIALRTRLRMFPESDYFGTPCMRGVIVGRSGTLRNNLYKKRLPLTAELLIKSARYMGASNGSWKNGFNFDRAPGSIVEFMTDLSITWVPSTIRNQYWDIGLNWLQRYDRSSFFFPAIKTVYSEEGSVLNNYLTICAIGQLNKIAHKAWREFSGSQTLTNAQLIDRVNSFVTANTIKRFDEVFVIIPNAHMTDMDLNRGYSWTLPIKIGSPMMKTVMTTYVQAYRIEDLAGE